MTLEEAIKHAEEVAEEKENEGKLLCNSEAGSAGCLKCAEEHRQLAEWLRDYKRLKEQEPVLGKIRSEIEQEYKVESEHPYGQGIRRALEIIDKYKAESE